MQIDSIQEPDRAAYEKKQLKKQNRIPRQIIN